MNLTIPELARAVGRNENFVRQHIHRGHLPVQKAGRRVLVPLDEALHWARSRDLPLVLPQSARSTATDHGDRVARITVLAWQEDGAPARNLFTLVRLRARHTLGPWAPETQGAWSCEPAENNLRLFWVDLPADVARAAVDEMVKTGVLTVGKTDVHYALRSTPRRHRAYRDQRDGPEARIRSPFRRYSSRMTEYWSPEDDLSDRWYELLEDPPSCLKPLLERLHFRLDHFSDRVGNAVVADAQDALVCSLSAGWDNTLHFCAKSKTPLPGHFRAAIWARHCQDDVLRLETPVTEGPRVIPVPSDVDEIGFSIYDTSDGQCLDEMAYYLIKDVVVNFSMDAGPTLKLKDRGNQRIRYSHGSALHSKIRIDSDEKLSGLDVSVRQRYLRRKSHQSQSAARRDRHLARFGPDEFAGATDFFIERLTSYEDAKEPIYIGEPYFMNAGTKSDVLDFYMRIFSATSSRPLNILCGFVEELARRPWWRSLPGLMTRHLRVRSFAVPNRDAANYFHDRYVITPDREISITNSFNGWKRSGVTFIQNPFDVYRTEAEYLWSLPEGYEGRSVSVREIYDGSADG